MKTWGIGVTVKIRHEVFGFKMLLVDDGLRLLAALQHHPAQQLL